MCIFLIDASGFIGYAIVPELLAAGHDVLGLARSDESVALVERLGAQAAQSDGVIHCAFIHDMNNYEESCKKELEGSNRAFILTSGTLMLRKDEPQGPSSLRAGSEKVAMSYVSRRVRSAGEHGFVRALIGIARNTGVSAYIGDGKNHWPAVHRLDAAAPAGSYLQATADEGVPTREIASLISRRLNVPLVSKTVEEAPAHFTWLNLSLGQPDF
ncbi:alcohol dehydrogenase [Lipomyces orientalis]|uniref:Alcohol dehydrogenase n=1 Tax=Lipomyces orientalis TaxID=1233043 RepID=A0ACC3TFJ2_9ASCO